MLKYNDICETVLWNIQNTLNIKKYTKLLTNVLSVFKAVDGHMCRGHSDHARCMGAEGGVRLSKWAQRYPDEFCARLAAAIKEYVLRP